MVSGRRVKVDRWVHSSRCVVRVVVDAVIPDAAPDEACLEPETIRWLDEVQRMADSGEFDRLSAIGDLYVRRSA